MSTCSWLTLSTATGVPPVHAVSSSPVLVVPLPAVVPAPHAAVPPRSAAAPSVFPTHPALLCVWSPAVPVPAWQPRPPPRTPCSPRRPRFPSRRWSSTSWAARRWSSPGDCAASSAATAAQVLPSWSNAALHDITQHTMLIVWRPGAVANIPDSRWTPWKWTLPLSLKITTTIVLSFKTETARLFSVFWILWSMFWWFSAIEFCECMLWLWTVIFWMKMSVSLHQNNGAKYTSPGMDQYEFVNVVKCRLIPIILKTDCKTYFLLLLLLHSAHGV